jgi:hypothetical protein
MSAQALEAVSAESPTGAPAWVVLLPPAVNLLRRKLVV